MRDWYRLVGLILAIGLAGCGGSTHAILPPTPTLVPLPAHQTVSLACPQGNVLDSRVSAHLLIASYFDALNRGDWERGFKYLFAPSAAPSDVNTATINGQDFAHWRAGYANTACTLVTFAGDDQVVTNTTPGYAGIGTGEVAPVTLTAIDLDGQVTIFAGTYVVRYDLALGVTASGAIAPDFSHLTQIN